MLLSPMLLSPMLLSPMLLSPMLRVFSLLFLFAATPVLAADVRKPNIIFILADDLGYGELGCYGQEKIKTPHIDRLAHQGIRFTHHYAGAPVCAPSRCVLMTGLHLGHAEVRNNWADRQGKWDRFGGQWPLSPGAVTIAERLKNVGYTTGAFGKWGLGGVGTSGDPLRQGFDRFFGYNCQAHAHNYYPRYLVDGDQQFPLDGNDRGLTGRHYASQVIADELLKFIRKNKNRPFFVYYPTIIPHLALQVPDRQLDQYRGKWPETSYTGDRYLPHPTPRACYAAMITFMDEQVGRITNLLDELGLTKDTIVFFTSDNGATHLSEQVDTEFFNSTAGLRGFKGSVYEGGIRVPLVARWPGRIHAGTTTDHVSAIYDVMATLCELVGIEAPHQTDGISFLPTLLGNAERQEEHEFLLWEFYGYGGQQAVRMDNWKGVRQRCHEMPDGPLELFDLADDVGEKRDVAAQHPEIVRRLEEIMQHEHTDASQWRFGKRE